MTEENETPVCFFCYDDDSETKFVTPHPCKCTGTTRVHAECFATVLKSYKACGACGTKYLSARPKLMRNGLQVIFTYYKRTITQLVENFPPTKKEEFTISAPGVKHGEYTMYAPNGVIIKTAFYSNNKLNGLETNYGPNGSVLHTMHYVDGKRHGPFKNTTLMVVLKLMQHFIMINFTDNTHHTMPTIKS